MPRFIFIDGQVLRIEEYWLFPHKDAGKFRVRPLTGGPARWRYWTGLDLFRARII